MGLEPEAGPMDTDTHRLTETERERKENGQQTHGNIQPGSQLNLIVYIHLRRENDFYRNCEELFIN